MRLLRSTLFNLAFYLTTAGLALGAAILAALGARRALRGLFVFWARLVVRLTEYALGGRIRIKSREAAPQGAALIVSNHQSELDGVLMTALFPRVAPVAMSELERYPFFGRILRGLGFLLVRTEGEAGRKGGQSEALVEAARAAMAEGRQVLIYPEGRLMPVGERGPWRSGVWRIYDALQIPAYPVAQDLGRLWPQRKWLKTPGAEAAVEFLPPIPPGLGKAEFMAELDRRIGAAASALEAEHAAAEIRSETGAVSFAAPQPRERPSGEPRERPPLGGPDPAL